jgi:hypothetical protein
MIIGDSKFIMKVHEHALGVTHINCDRVSQVVVVVEKTRVKKFVTPPPKFIQKGENEWESIVDR